MTIKRRFLRIKKPQNAQNKSDINAPDLQRMRTFARNAQESLFDKGKLAFALLDLPAGNPSAARTLSPPNALIFQHIPTESTEQYRLDWDTVLATGRRMASLQFKQGMPREIKFELFVNEWGVHTVTSAGKTYYTAEQTVQWLREKAYPYGKGRRLVPPRVLSFLGWEVIQVVVVDIKVKRTLLRSIKDRPFEAAGHSKNPWGVKKTRSPGQMIRGTIELQLREYVPPPNGATFFTDVKSARGK